MNLWIDRVINIVIKEEEMIKRIVRIKVIDAGDAFLLVKESDDYCILRRYRRQS